MTGDVGKGRDSGSGSGAHTIPICGDCAADR
jgi:hypothetical protein